MECQRCGKEINVVDDCYMVAEYHYQQGMIRVSLCGACANEAIIKRLIEKGLRTIDED